MSTESFIKLILLIENYLLFIEKIVPKNKRVKSSVSQVEQVPDCQMVLDLVWTFGLYNDFAIHCPCFHTVWSRALRGNRWTAS